LPLPPYRGRGDVIVTNEKEGQIGDLGPVITDADPRGDWRVGT